MSQEISVSDQAVKSKVYRLIDAAVEGEKTEQQIRESMQRWWELIHPADRIVAQKHLLRVLQRTHAGLNAMTHAFLESAEEKPGHGLAHETPAKAQLHEMHVEFTASRRSIAVSLTEGS